MDATGNATIAEDAVNDGSTDACGGLIFDTDVTSFSCANVGTNDVKLTVTDKNGNSASKPAVVTVEDKIKPTVVTQPVTIYLDAAGKASTTAAAVNNGSTDNCSIASYALSKTNFDCSNVGANTVTLTVTDVNGNSNSATATVTVVDNIKPTVLTKTDIIYLDAYGNASTSVKAIDKGSYDNCGIATMTLSKTSFDCSNVGANTVTLTVTDVNGNVNSAPAFVIVQDKITPTVITRNIIAELDNEGKVSITPAQIDNGSKDNCSEGVNVYKLSKTDFDCSNVGANTVTLTVTDVNGNTSSATAIVSVEDHISPKVLAENVKGYLDSKGSYTLEWTGNASISDNCGIQKKEFSKTSFDCSNVGENDVDIIVTDMSGNVTRKTFKLTLEDGTTPQLDVVADQKAQAWQKSVQVKLTGLSGVIDCPIQKINSIVAEASNTQIVTGSKVDYIEGQPTAILTLNLVQGVAGSSKVTVTVTDNSGTANGGINQISRSFILTVEPNHAPQVTGTVNAIKVNRGATLKVTPPANLFTDPDAGDVLTYSLEATKGSSIPSWISLDKTAGEIQLAPTAEAIGQHKFTIVAADILGLTAKYEITITVEIPTAVEIIDGASLTVYPNPTKGIVNIAVSNAKEDRMEISIYSSAGSKVYSGIHDVSAPIQIDLSGQSNGIYFVRFSGSLKGITEKIVLNQ